MKPIKAWHFVGETLRDGSPIPKDRRWLKYDGAIEICRSGLHASRQPFDALQYAPGATLCLVDCRGTIIEQEDKLVCSERRIVARMDATEMLRYFARMQAVSCLDSWTQQPDQVVLDWLMTGDETARSAARSAAWSAARSAARSTAESAAEAAWSAAESAARSATRSAAWSATESATESAAEAAAWSAAEAAAWSAAESAARSAAWSAAWSAAEAAREDFNQTVFNCFADYL